MTRNESQHIEGIRPTMYRSLKYWGKKPHNIWSKIIKDYSNPGDTIFDPFSGSALTFFEAIRIGRKPIVIDTNPLSAFLVQVFSEETNVSTLKEIADKICIKARRLEIYQKNYTIQCVQCGMVSDIYNYRWCGDRANEVAYKCPHCSSTIIDVNANQEYKFELGLWKPSYDMGSMASVSESTINGFGGSDISNIWTHRNLELLSYIFDEICAVDEPYKQTLVFAFLQSVHLTTKMCATRSNKSNRPLSSSWGRPAYMYLNKRMEQNPVIQFERALFGSSGVLKAIKNRDQYIPKYSFSSSLGDFKKVDGVALCTDSKDCMITEAVDLIVTDPPYGSIIQYGELSMVWNAWLQHAYPKYRVALDKEIIINGNSLRSEYESGLTDVFLRCYDALCESGTMIVTFNSNSTDDWNSLTAAIDNSGFTVVDYFWQQNKRTSEANVSGTSEIASSDYYLILTKRKDQASRSILQTINERIIGF